MFNINWTKINIYINFMDLRICLSWQRRSMEPIFYEVNGKIRFALTIICHQIGNEYQKKKLKEHFLSAITEHNFSHQHIQGQAVMHLSHLKFPDHHNWFCTKRTTRAIDFYLSIYILYPPLWSNNNSLLPIKIWPVKSWQQVKTSLA